MDKKSIIVIVGIVVLALGILIVVSFQKGAMDTSSSDLTATTTGWENAPASAPPAISEKLVVTAKHAYRNGVHIIAGEMPLPTPCHLLESQAVVSTDAKQVLVQFTSSTKPDQMCAQVITPARFKVTAKANKDAVITATLNGQPVSFNFIEAGPTEDLDDFELYIKG
jgi:hypothetical protein